MAAEDMLVGWTKQNTIVFIELLESHPCLWRVKHKSYKNKQLRASAINQMCYKLSHVMNMNISADHVMKKLHTLRSQYQKELRAIHNSQKAGAEGEDLYTPKLWCFHLLKFLGEGIYRGALSGLENTKEVSGSPSSETAYSGWSSNQNAAETDQWEGYEEEHEGMDMSHTEPKMLRPKMQWKEPPNSAQWKEPPNPAQYSKQPDASEENAKPKSSKDVMVTNFSAYIKSALDMLSMKSVLRFQREATQLLLNLQESEMEPNMERQLPPGNTY